MSLLSLDQWRNQMHYNPWHFWGFAGALTPVTSQCNTVVKQYSWQTANAVGRTEIVQAIEEAEVRLAEQLHFAVAPRFREDVKQYPNFYDRNLWPRWPIAADGHWKPVALSEGYLDSVGIEKLDLVLTPTVAYSDLDGDGLKETFTLSVPTTVTDPTELNVYFNSTDRWDGSGWSDRWRISPVRTTLAGGVATIVGRSWMLGRPILYESYQSPELDPSVSSNFASTVDVVRRSVFNAGQTVDDAEGKFVWETLPYPVYWGLFTSTDGSTDPSAYAYSVARVGIHGEPRLGVVIPGQAIFDPTTGKWNMEIPPWSSVGLFRPPQKVVIRYRAGYPLGPDGQMDSGLQTMVFRLSAAQLDNRICACDEANRELYRWQREMAQVMDRTEGYRISDKDLDCPWGTRRGAIDAWRQTKFKRMLRPATTP